MLARFFCSRARDATMVINNSKTTLSDQYMKNLQEMKKKCEEISTHYDKYDSHPFTASLEEAKERAKSVPDAYYYK